MEFTKLLSKRDAFFSLSGDMRRKRPINDNEFNIPFPLQGHRKILEQTGFNQIDQKYKIPSNV
jgi:hypothetical protein